ncbi:hypothetical protein TWF106_007938 [Orbilia oligospora]|uniref:Uncharacterized protein n=1 Tax=Orbilia oligospora TaxID=2813651 RepID=A0A6G1MEW5_ORBOL|nr:hypothetical protein TWF788_007088 [Orbilia oligospora]KAF3215397.1 hypothetical protein TWF679_003920 [Orbilia oligospora]KAF3217429.1 hypothetical protein TWF106_007938 [Orbilia oligospora]KAF3222606.1 hypothetical protein TWF191_006687 [Orbilia oligospora]KAF3255246.1 hypothetical protein TWF192_002606 [Orbilia oligospora]
MDDEVEATQPSTQPATQQQQQPERQKVAPDPNILLILHPASPAANIAVAYLARRYPAYVRNHVESSLPGYICLTSSVPPKNPDAGFTFGRNPVKCDVALGQQSSSRRVSNVHFRVFTTDEGVIMLEDCSTNGTWVDNVCLQSPRALANRHQTHASNTRRRILTNSSQILLALGPVEDELKFIVDLKSTSSKAWEQIRGANRPAGKNGMLPPGRRPQAGQGHGTDATSEQYPFPDGWTGENGIYEVGDIIGKGAFAIVRKLTQKSTGSLYAVKIINKRVFGPQEESGRKNGKARYLGVLKEVEIMEQLKHPNIIHYEEYKEMPRQLYIRMEYVGFGDLSDYVKGRGAMPEDLTRMVTQQVNNALVFIHGLNISHRDIKPDNILIKSEDPLVVKLSDFGLAKMITEDQDFNKTFCGTMLYLAPEVFPTVVGVQNPVTRNIKYHKENRRYSHVCDMWSLGCVVYTLLTGDPPFTGATQEEIQQKICAGNWDVAKLSKCGISEIAIDLVKKFLITDPTKRLNEKEALRHPWLEDGTSEDDCSQGAMPPYIDEDEEEVLSQQIEVWEEVKGRLEKQDPARLSDVDVRDLLKTRVQHVQDHEGDVEIEGSQEQARRLERERERERVAVPSSQLRQVHNADSLDKTVVPPLRRRVLDNSLLGPPEDEESFEGSDVNSEIAGLRDYPDNRIQEDEAEVSSPDNAYEESGVFGQSHVSEMEASDEESQFYGLQAGRVADSMISSEGEYDSFVGIAKTPISDRSMTVPRRRTPGPDGRSLAGMRTMVGNLNVASMASESILHRKGSGRLTTDDRVTKRGSSPSLRRKSSPHDVPSYLSRLPLENKMSIIDSEGSNANHDDASTHEVAMAKTDSLTTRNEYGLENDVAGHDEPQQEIEAEAYLSPSQQSSFSRPKSIWGRLNPLPCSINHEPINLVDQHVRYGRSSACVCFVSDTRVSKHHFVLLFAREDDIETLANSTENEESFTPHPQMKAWIKVLGTNGIILHGRRLSKNDFFRVFDQDDIIIFRDRNEFLGFRIDLMVGDHGRTAQDLKFERDWDAMRAYQIAAAKQARMGLPGPTQPINSLESQFKAQQQQTTRKENVPLHDQLMSDI